MTQYSVYEWWQDLKPKKCRGCECIVLDWDFDGNPNWGCKAESCYLDD